MSESGAASRAGRSARRFALASSEIVTDTIDGEVIVINLNNGNYYSLTGTGAAAWEVLARGYSLDETVAILGCRYDGEREAIDLALDGFVRELVAERLIRADGDTAAPGSLGREDSPGDRATIGGRTAFVPPLLEKYSDMQQLLLLDPIHEVDERGWPTVTGEPAAPDDKSG